MAAAAGPGVATPAGRQVVVDAGAAIRLQRLERFGGRLFTTSGVLAEVKDEHARALLRTLPQELHVREPLTQDIAYAKQFAKATGDLGFLSQNDIELIALTVALHREDGGRLRDRPTAPAMGEGHSAFDWAPPKPAEGPSSAATAPQPREAASGTEAHVEAPLAEAQAEASVAGDVDTKAHQEHELNTAVALSVLRARAAEPAALGRAAEELPGEPAPEPGPTGAPPAVPPPDDVAAAEAPEPEPLVAAVEPEPDVGGAIGSDCERGEAQDGQEERVDGEASEDGSSAGEWVTPENLHRFGRGVEAPAEEVARVTCATADYSMQNVLLQMGITPLTFDGYAVRTVKVWGLICRACFFFTRDTEKVFCPKCGHDTVVRVPIIVDQEGKATVLNSGRKLRTKGTIYSIPKRQGGRGWKPIFAEDELLLGGRDRELRHAQRLCDKERQARDPFNEDNGARSWYQRGTTATGKQLGLNAPRVEAGYGRRNPNANNFKFKTGGKKRR